MGLQLGDLVDVVADRLGHPEQHLAALARVKLAPGAGLEGPLGRADRAVDILFPAAGEPCKHGSRSRVGGLERLARGGGDLLSVDDHAALLDSALGLAHRGRSLAAPVSAKIACAPAASALGRLRLSHMTTPIPITIQTMSMYGARLSGNAGGG